MTTLNSLNALTSMKVMEMYVVKRIKAKDCLGCAFLGKYPGAWNQSLDDLLRDRRARTLSGEQERFGWETVRVLEDLYSLWLAVAREQGYEPRCSLERFASLITSDASWEGIRLSEMEAEFRRLKEEAERDQRVTAAKERLRAAAEDIAKECDVGAKDLL